jgi:hypothetical protein
MKEVERPIAGRTTLEKIISRLPDAIRPVEVEFRPGGSAKGTSMKLVVITATGYVFELADRRLQWRCDLGEGRANWT